MGLSLSLSPILWLSVELHDGYYDYLAGLELINNTIRKASEKASAGVSREGSPSEWKVTYVLYGGMHLLRELQPKALLTGVIVINGISFLQPILQLAERLFSGHVFNFSLI
jgi:hypothetical protein